MGTMNFIECISYKLGDLNDNNDKKRFTAVLGSQGGKTKLPKY